jgi:hypothetical protein
MWTWRASSGCMVDAAGVIQGVGYAGGACGKNPEGKNNPVLQRIYDVGPLPQGKYKIACPVNTVTHGPCVLWLTPDPANEMYGRADFGIHGDSVVSPGDASDGCIVLPRSVREMIASSGDDSLEVVP